jgi:hypothetical protein
MAKAPTPVTKNPWLPSEGYDQMKATKHRYIKAVESTIPGEGEEWEDVWLYIFACEETGAERVWGYASRNLTEIPLATDN